MWLCKPASYIHSYRAQRQPRLNRTERRRHEECTVFAGYGSWASFRCKPGSFCAVALHYASRGCPNEMTRAGDGYELLAGIRGLERQLRRLRADWRSFRDIPSTETLEDIRHRTRQVSAVLDDLASRLGTSDEAMRVDITMPRLESGRQQRPTPREVVAASRDLDSWISQATRQWKGVVGGEGEHDLSALVRVLESSAHRAETLISALGGSVDAYAESLRTPDAAAGAHSDRMQAWSAELGAMLWRLQSDWQHVRRAPSPERIRVLRAGLQQAAGTASRLRDERQQAGETAFRRALRVGHHLRAGVQFLPYRDPFTGAYNREGFDALAGAELKRCRRYGRRFGLLILEVSPPDLDGLQRVVATARAELREYDLIARYTEDLIVVGIPEGGPGPTRRVASRVLKAMRNAGMGSWFQRLAYATLPEDGSTLGGLMNSARQRLQA